MQNPIWEKAVENLHVKLQHKNVTFLKNINFKWYKASPENSMFLKI